VQRKIIRNGTVNFYQQGGGMKFYRNPNFYKILAVLGLLYLFLTGIGLLGAAFKLMGSAFSDKILQTTTNPLDGLFIGILATTLVQSSSVTTSLVIGLVAGDALTLANAIPIIMGANIGTTVTNTLVSLAHVNQKEEFKRAFSASTVHDFFNILAVFILFPLHIITSRFIEGGILGWMANGIATAFNGIGGLTFVSPIKWVTEPVVHFCKVQFADHPTVLVILSILFIFAALRYLVKILKSLVVSRLDNFFDNVLFASPLRGFMFGLLLTVMVQSSSITTSIAVPLVGAGLITLLQIFPYTLGANVGTTITAVLASFATGNLVAVTVAFTHVIFNIMGIAIIWPIKSIRNLPIRMANFMAKLAIRSKLIPLAYILVVFYIIPLVVIIILE